MTDKKEQKVTQYWWFNCVACNDSFSTEGTKSPFENDEALCQKCRVISVQFPQLFDWVMKVVEAHVARAESNHWRFYHA